ncbi:hypothetical protein JCM14036_35420 [Desulfotomaculum defluvii]
MLAVSFFFILTGGIIIIVSTVGFFLNFLSKDYAQGKKWGLPFCGGFLSLLLGMLMAMS